MKNGKFAVIGGDSRHLFAARALLEMGYTVSLYGIDTHGESLDGICVADSLSSALEKADALLLPAPYTRDNRTLSAPLSTRPIELEALFSSIDKKTAVIAGLSSGISDELSVYDYMLDEEYALKNALSTAEGAIAVIIKETPFNLQDSVIFVLGYGRISRLLSSKLSLLGARVTVFARSSEQRTLASVNGISALPLSLLSSQIENADLVVNTVPAGVVDAECIKHASPSLIYVELASGIGGCDRHSAAEKGLKLVSAPSLPGKYSPASEGASLARVAEKALERHRGGFTV